MSSFAQINEFWGRLSTARKVLLIGVAVASIVGFAFLISWVREPVYCILLNDAKSLSNFIRLLLLYFFEFP